MILGNVEKRASKRAGYMCRHHRVYKRCVYCVISASCCSSSWFLVVMLLLYVPFVQCCPPAPFKDIWSTPYPNVSRCFAECLKAESPIPPHPTPCHILCLGSRIPTSPKPWELSGTENGSSCSTSAAWGTTTPTPSFLRRRYESDCWIGPTHFSRRVVWCLLRWSSLTYGGTCWVV